MLLAARPLVDGRPGPRAGRSRGGSRAGPWPWCSRCRSSARAGTPCGSPPSDPRAPFRGAARAAADARGAPDALPRQRRLHPLGARRRAGERALRRLPGHNDPAGEALGVRPAIRLRLARRVRAERVRLDHHAAGRRRERAAASSFSSSARTRSFQLWRRVGTLEPRQLLVEGAGAAARLDCSRSRGRRLVRRGGLATVRAPTRSVPVGPVGAGGVREVDISLTEGEWDLQAPYLSQHAIEVTGDGFRATLPAQLDRPGRAGRSGASGFRRQALSHSGCGSTRVRSRRPALPHRSTRFSLRRRARHGRCPSARPAGSSWTGTGRTRTTLGALCRWPSSPDRAA